MGENDVVLISIEFESRLYFENIANTVLYLVLKCLFCEVLCNFMNYYSMQEYRTQMLIRF